MRINPLIIAPLAILAAPLSAAPSQPEITVGHADLDLSNERDVERLNQRIKSKVWRACDVGTPGLAALRIEQKCRHALMTEAARKVQLAVAEATAGNAQLAKAAAPTVTTGPGA